MKYCAQCGTTKFGLVRYSRGTRQFCSMKCLKAYEAALETKIAAVKQRLLTIPRRRRPQ
jgi:hypothetical protein